LHVLKKKPVRGLSMELVRKVAELSKEADLLVIANAMLLPAVSLSRSSLAMIWDTNECQSLHYSRLPRTGANVVKGAVWHVLESWAARRCSLAVAISSAEEEVWRTLQPGLRSKLAVVDHRVDARPTPHELARQQLEALCQRPIPGPLLVFVGNLVGKQNVAAAKWLIEVLAPVLPADATLVLAGPGTEMLRPEPDAKVDILCLGTVEDVDSVIAAADFCLAPLAAGAGVKTKVLHYIAHGRRVIGTPFAFEGILDAPGLLTADLDQIPLLILEAIHRPEPEGQELERQRQQELWLEDHHGRQLVAEEWKLALANAGLM
jgi:hypothetical protein